MTDTRQTDALAALYNALATARAKGPRTVRELTPDARAAYDREAKRRQRQRARAAKAGGMPEATDAAIREALSDAALLLLAVGGPGADAIQHALTRAFPGRPGVAGTVRMRAGAGALKPRVLTAERLAAQG